MNIKYEVNQRTGAISYSTSGLGGSVRYATGSGGSSGDGLTPAQVESLIRGSVQDWAETGNTDAIPISKIPNLAASKVTSGTFDVARIPNLDGNKITSGTIGDNRIPASIARDSEVTAAIASAIANLSLIHI